MMMSLGTIAEVLDAVGCDIEHVLNVRHATTGQGRVSLAPLPVANIEIVSEWTTRYQQLVNVCDQHRDAGRKSIPCQVSHLSVICK